MTRELGFWLRLASDAIGLPAGRIGGGSGRRPARGSAVVPKRLPEDRDGMRLGIQPLEPRFALTAAAGTKVTSVTAPAAGSYKAGDDLVFEVAFNKPVAVVGTPRIDLSIGAAIRSAEYRDGSGSNRLTFRYTIRAGDTDSDGIATQRSIRLPAGASVRDAASQAAASVRITPPNTSRVLVDTKAPSVAAVRGPGPAIFTAGSTLTFKVRFTEPVFATASDRRQVTLPIAIGGTTRDAVWNGDGSGTRWLSFTAVPHPGDTAPSGLMTAGPIGTSGGATLRDRAGNDVNPTVSATFPKTRVNGVAPSASTLQGLLSQGIVADPAGATVILPTGQPGNATATAQTIPVATLESDYETIFGGLNATLGVTLNSKQNLDKIDYLKGQAAAGNFDLLAKPIENNPLGVTAVAFQPVTYQTTVDLPAGPQTFQVSGGLLIPQGIDKTQIKGVVVYFHGTTFDKSSVPSNYCVEAQLCAELFASQGYVVVAPDYVGQGVDWQNVHPYVLYPQVSAKTAVDMLTAVKPILAATLQRTADDPALKLFSVGYSEGGAYSLWFNSFISASPGVLDPSYALTHSVGLEGAYDTSNVIRNFLFSDVGKGAGNPFNIQTLALTNLVKPLLTADALLSFATYGMGGDVGKVFNANYYQLTASRPISQSLCTLDGSQVDVAQAFAQPTGNCGLPLFFAAINKRANAASYLFPTVLDPTNAAGKLALALRLSQSTHNNMLALASSFLVVDPEGRSLLDGALTAANVDLSPCANDGVSIVSLAEDSVVTPNNFDVLATAFPDKIASAIKLNQDDFMVVSATSKDLGWPLWVPTDHMQALIYEFIYALNIFNSHAGTP